MAGTLVVGVDFGTTFSGVAFAYSGNAESPDEINIVKTWPGGNNITSDKVPSELAYTTKSNSTSGGRNVLTPLADFVKLAIQDASANPDVRWGLQILPDEDRLRCLKLLLDPTQAVPDYVSLPDMRHQLLACGKNVGTATADLLRAIFDHAKEVMTRRFGEHFIKTTKMKVVCTVPAVWSDAAKDATLKAAEAAGMGNVTLVSEPEAGALYTLQAIQPNHLKVGENFVVIDAGGGTVDLVTYCIKQLSPLRLEEVVQGSGGFCGASFLNIRFEELVRSKLGPVMFDSLKTRKPKSWQSALRYFEEYVKRNFNPNEQRDTFNITLPGAPDKPEVGIEDGFLELKSWELATLFEPILVDIVELVQDQVDRVHEAGEKVHGFVLIGGFGQSECLLQRIKTHFTQPSSKNGRKSGSIGLERGVEVLQPINAWTAVARGAVLRGLEKTESVIARKARRHYGVICVEDFDPSVHNFANKFWDDLSEAWQADNQMLWYIAKGDTVSASEPSLFDFSLVGKQPFTTTTQQLIICDDAFAPSTFSDNAGSPTRVACTMVVNLDAVPKHLWKKAVNSKNRRYFSLDFQIGMQVESGGLRFDVRVDGVVYGKVTAAFE